MIDFKELKRSRQKLIYLLSDPRDDILFCYVGQTNSSSRFAAHMATSVLRQIDDSSAKAKLAWIADLRESGLEFLIYPLEICDDSVSNIREWEWIGRAEVSPFHIPTNSLIDRAIGAAVIGDQAFPPLPGAKPNRMALIKALTEVYAHFASRGAPPDNVVTGYKLLREKVATTVTEEQFEVATQLTATEFWKSNLGPKSWHILSIGAVGNYIEDDVRTDPCMPVAVQLTSYVPWSLVQRGTTSPEQLRVKSRTDFINTSRSKTQVSSATTVHSGKCALRGPPFTESELRPLRSSKAQAKAVPRGMDSSATDGSGQKVPFAQPPRLERNMSSSELTLRKFDRWSSRINDPSRDVRREATEILSTLAAEEPMLADKCVHALQAYIQVNTYRDLFHALSAVAELPISVIREHPTLISTVASVPLADKFDAARVGEFFLKLTEGTDLTKNKDDLKLVIERAKFGLSLEHHGGRSEFMKVVDWAEDNGFEFR